MAHLVSEKVVDLKLVAKAIFSDGSVAFAEKGGGVEGSQQGADYSDGVSHRLADTS